jgi:tRNA (cmo5U34)-methyltransferase
MTELLEEMSAFFNSRADSYNTVHLEHVGGMASKQVIAAFLPSHTKAIIDFGIGTGLELEEIFKRFPDVEVTGLDIAENMLQLLKESYPGKNIKLHCESYLNFDFGHCHYDVALSVMTFHHYTHKTKVDLYRRIHDCIKQNGVYIECDYMLSEHEHENVQAMEDYYFSEYKRLKEEQGITDDREYHYDTPCTVANQINMLLEAGFRDANEVWLKGNAVLLVANK